MIKDHKIDIPVVLNRLPGLPAVFGRFDAVAAAYLFGSLCTEHYQPLSDVDIAVLLTPDTSPKQSWELWSRIHAALSTALNTEEIDLTILNNAPLTFRYQVLHCRRLLYERDAALRIDFETTTLLQYLDFQPMKDALDKAMLKRLAGS